VGKMLFLLRRYLMKIRKIRFFYIFLCLLFVFSCATLAVKRDVQNNVFYSSYNPKTKIDINSDIPFINKYEYDSGVIQFMSGEGGGTNYKSEIYMFAQVGDGNIINKAVCIEIHKLTSGFWTHDLLVKIQNRLDSGVIKYHGEAYQYAIFVSSNLLGNKLRRDVSKEGVIASSCYLSRKLGRIADRDDTLIYVTYAEDIFYNKSINKYKCSEWQKAITLTLDQKLFLAEFIHRCEKAVKILGEDFFVDKPHKKSDSKKPNGKLENKLIKLRNLLKEGLITQEEYDKKKTELLEKF